MGKLIIDGNSVYELDEGCMQSKSISSQSMYAQSKRKKEIPEKEKYTDEKKVTY